MDFKLGGFAPLIQVFDMPTSIAFYRDVLGFTVDSDVPDDGQCDFAMLQLEDSVLMLNTAYEAHERPPARDAAVVAAHHDVGLFFGCSDVDAAYAFLRERGLAVEPPVVRDYGMKQLYLADPDGYVICLQHPVEGSDVTPE